MNERQTDDFGHFNTCLLVWWVLSQPLLTVTLQSVLETPINPQAGEEVTVCDFFLGMGV